MSDNERREPAGEEEVHTDTPAPQPENASDVEERSHEGSEQDEDDDKKKDKYDRSGPHPIVGLIIFLVVQFVALVLLTVATPIEMFVLNDQYKSLIFPNAPGDKDICVTAWGMKSGCRSRGYYNRDYSNTFCPRIRLNFKIIEAFCIMALGFMTLALITSIFSICQKVGKPSVGALGVFAVFLALIPWGVMAGMYHQSNCCEIENWHTEQQTEKICQFAATSPAAGNISPGFKDMGKYGAGFGLCVAAWALEVVAVIFAFLPF